MQWRWRKRNEAVPNLVSSGKALPIDQAAYKQRFVDIIVDAFQQNPAVWDVVKQDAKKDVRLRRLATYSFEFGARRNGNYLTQDRNGIVISYVEDMKRSIHDHWADLLLILRIAGLSRARYLLRKEAYRASVRPKEPFYYVWFLGIETGHRGGPTGKELKERIFSEAAQQNLPILLETTIEKNKRAYEYFGFEVYHTHQFHKGTPPTYFMRREIS